MQPSAAFFGQHAFGQLAVCLCFGGSNVTKLLPQCVLLCRSLALQHCTSSCVPLVATRPRPLAQGPSQLCVLWPAVGSRLAALVGINEPCCHQHGMHCAQAQHALCTGAAAGAAEEASFYGVKQHTVTVLSQPATPCSHRSRSSEGVQP